MHSGSTAVSRVAARKVAPCCQSQKQCAVAAPLWARETQSCVFPQRPPEEESCTHRAYGGAHFQRSKCTGPFQRTTSGHVGVPSADERRIEVLAQDLPCFGAQLAVDVTLRSPLRSTGEPHPNAADVNGAMLLHFFFARRMEEGQRKNQCKVTLKNASSRSAMSGGTPSTPDKSHRGIVREPANQQDTDSMRIHRRLQAKKAERCNTGVASCDLGDEIARFDTPTPAGLDCYHRICGPPPARNSSRRAALATAPSTAAFGQALPLAVTSLRNVTSIQLRPVFERQTEARTSTSRSSLAATVTFISLSLTLHRTTAPASRQMRARVLSGATAQERKRPDRRHVARCLPKLSTKPPHSQRTFCNVEWEP